MMKNLMPKIKELDELNLSDNNLDSKAASDIANMLVENFDREHTIKKLDISSNNIGADGL